MSHLTVEQFEEIVHGQAEFPDHLNQCSRCRARLAEKRALAGRLRDAFASVEASPALAGRIRAGIVGSESAVDTVGVLPLRIIPAAHRHLWSGLAAAAAILLIAVPVALYFGTASSAEAAQAELVAIHRKNIRSLGDLIVHDDPNHLARYLSGATRHDPGVTCPVTGDENCTCCVRQFRGRRAASYVIRTPSGLISLIVVLDPPESLGLVPAEPMPESNGPLWRGACEDCHIASIRIDAHSYFAVGKVSHTELQDILHGLVD